ncbi:MAG TPA: hypothetical protein VGX25_07750 [Actinophytocola sp.]|uniref:hypothetical protein n=1 Tax=Actinophytocola sp. TaxID=1872138 RepID=UPI002DDD3510|nr:hypothetical protein [Actinophytocola sp.]HEV2779281.1 hypothetical protein [Actinophytocola sp.]
MTTEGTHSHNEVDGPVTGSVVQVGHLAGTVNVYLGEAERLKRQLTETQAGLAAVEQQRNRFLAIVEALVTINMRLKDDRQRLLDKQDDLRLQLEQTNERQAEVLRTLRLMDRRARDLALQLTRTSRQLGQAHDRIDEANRLIHVLQDRAKLLEARLRTELPSVHDSNLGIPEPAIPVSVYRQALDRTEEALQSGTERMAQLNERFAQPPVGAPGIVGAEPADAHPAPVGRCSGHVAAERGDSSLWKGVGGLAMVGVMAFVIYGNITSPRLDYASGNRPEQEWTACFSSPCVPLLIGYKWNLSDLAGITTNFTTNRSDVRSLTGTLSYDPDRCPSASIDWSVRGDGTTLSSGTLTAEQPRIELDAPLADGTQRITFTASRSPGDTSCALTWDSPKVHTDNFLAPL